MSEALFNYQFFYTYLSSIERFTKFVEVGVYTGASCAFLAKRLLARNAEFELYAVDLWDETSRDYPPMATAYRDFIARLQRESLEQHVRIMRTSSVEAAAHFQDTSLDFVFIDADHAYESVKADIQAWKPKIKVHGMISGHDYGEPCGVKQAVDEMLHGNISLNGTCWYTFIK